MSAFCTSCGAPRLPLGAKSLTHAGQPSMMGGTLTRFLGWALLALSLLAALALGGLVSLFWGMSGALTVGLPTAALGAWLSWLMLRGGTRLKDAGQLASETARNEAIFALAKSRSGVLTPWDVSQMLGLGLTESDSVLTELAKQHPDYVKVDLTEDGKILYRFPTIAWGALPSGMRIDAAFAEQVRVAPTAAGEPLEMPIESPNAHHRTRRD